MRFIEDLINAFKENNLNNALCINNIFYSYEDFIIMISKIRFQIVSTIKDSEKLVGLVTNDDIETYASIIALWLEGKAYVPVNPESPIERNIQVFYLTNTKYIFDSAIISQYEQHHEFNVILSKSRIQTEINLSPKKVSGDEIAYILFTSGTTGQPKGVPISFNNIQALVDAINEEPEFNLNASDRCLQMFELTFDFSLVTYLFPFLAGACIYTIPKGKIKYFYIFKLIQSQNLTVLTMVPSIINYLRPYFNEINAPYVRYCSFGGGALHEGIAKEWSDCLPNCKIFNYYGPTEFTVYSGFYPYNKITHTKSYNGIIAIGKPQKDTSYLIVNDTNKEIKTNTVGELCLAGPQITSGYWKNENQNLKSFFSRIENNKSIRYYKTGDLCIKDNDGDFLYVGRLDFQVKIRGYRVELTEIEYHAKKISTHKVNMVAIDVYNKLDNAELGLAIESEPFDTEPIMNYLKTRLPGYMIPMHVEFIKEFPHSMNGKIDRNSLRTYFIINE